MQFNMAVVKMTRQCVMWTKEDVTDISCIHLKEHYLRLYVLCDETFLIYVVFYSETC